MIPQHEREAFEHWEMPEDVLSDLVPDGRIGAPVPNRNRKRLTRLAIAGLMGCALYALAAMEPRWYDAVTERAHALAEALVQARTKVGAENIPVASPPLAEAAMTSTPPETGAAQEVPAAPSEGELPLRAVEETPPITATAYTSEAAPAPEERDHSAARTQAAKAGLGPDLPNVLLTRLSKADLENAAYAIKTALKKTPETATLSWPPKPSATQALFEVRFVAGAEDGCRRYVVTVTKEHWSSTSGAVEKCNGEQTP